ncbi:MAG TPA: flagellar protein FlgN [Herbaspirillum sp.]
MQRPATSLAEEFTALHQLQDLLQEEQKALTEGAVDSLPELVSSKANIISQITVLADGRHQALAAIGMEASENGMQSWIEASGADAEKQQWSELLSLATEVKELNRLNGILISKHAQTNQQMMSLVGSLVGANFYGPDGQSSIKASARKFGAA